VRFSVAAALLVTAAAPDRAARAESEARQTIEEVRDLMAPASHLELRCDLSLLTTRRLGDGRAGLDVEIATRPDYWYGLGVATIAGTTATTTTTAGGATVTTIESTDAIGLSARLFKRFGPLVLSAGIVDSAGGAGLELRALGDRLRLEVLATNWQPSEPRTSPHVRFGGSAQWRLVYVQAGVLDLLDDPRASAYVGVGLRWRDPDILSTAAWLRR
jgi:hypothetical protein